MEQGRHVSETERSKMGAYARDVTSRGGSKREDEVVTAFREFSSRENCIDFSTSWDLKVMVMQTSGTVMIVQTEAGLNKPERLDFAEFIIYIYIYIYVVLNTTAWWLLIDFLVTFSSLRTHDLCSCVRLKSSRPNEAMIADKRTTIKGSFMS